ncbi:DNA alkylation repair protein [Cupriavidus basilensis]|uniref:DNA alkylation repair protein n=1 Tax=Cupriavidus TaxID=106589 RepID=UPI000A83E2E0|nr:MULTISPECIES: DNA alkylation repair protein [Cupriavidus]MDF3884604.1 DNA alkylation repair protein [Cupriavidus basilensis]
MTAKRPTSPTDITPEAYVEHVRHALRPLADPAAASQMRAYMRDQFPFLGIPTPARRRALRALPTVGWCDREWVAVAQLLWREPEREYRYAAADLLRKHADRLDAARIAPILALAQVEPWWDTVDSLAVTIGTVIARARKTDVNAQARADAWLGHDSPWVRRVAMLHQLGWRLETDEARLFRYARTLAPETDFFIRKSIGWALRDYARWNPAAVSAFLAAHRDRLSALTVREAEKHLQT